MSNKSELRELAKTVYDSIKIVDHIRHDTRQKVFLHYTIDEEEFNSLNEYYKLYVLKKNINSIILYYNDNEHNKLTFKNKDFIYNTFKQHPNILIELLEYTIIRNNIEIFGYIFKHHKKDIVLKKDVYKKLLDISSRFTSSTIYYYRIIKHYETEDMLYNNDEDDEIIEKEKELEIKNYQILLLEKDKKIETLKIELEELRKFYIDS